MTMLSVRFEFRSSEYYALVRVKEKEARTEYHITVMNGELERLLYGHHVIIKEDGEIKFDMLPDTEVGKLKCAVTEALNSHMKLAPEHYF